MRTFAIVFLTVTAGPAFAEAVPRMTTGAATTNDQGRAARDLFQSDAALNYWALKHYDADGDIALSPAEAATAADALKVIADGDLDGRITTYEFDRAREFIAARF